MNMFEKLRRCKYCSRDMTDSVSPDSYQQNPYCAVCDSERTQAAVEALGETTLCEVGGYLYFSPTPQTLS